MTDAVPLSARVVLTLATAAYGLGPFIIDMNKTHLLHPAWPGHARFHLLWATASQFFVASGASWLIWSSGPDAAWHCRLGAGIGFCMTSGFWIAVLFKKAYRGTLHDPNGIPPIAGKVDGNIIAVILIMGILIYGYAAIP